MIPAPSPGGVDGHYDSPKVVVFSGHMTDAPDRPIERFPAAWESPVRAAMVAVLQGWEIGPGDICLSSGARGGDILFAETCLAAGARVRWLLPLPIEEFIDRSVRTSVGEWEQRFRALLDQVKVSLPHDMAHFDESASPFAQGNSWLLATAQTEAGSGQPLVLLLWDGQAGDGSGGTADVAVQVQHFGWPMKVVNPARV